MTETEQKKRTPPPGSKLDSFIVQCEGFRCMAYRDPKGQWRDYFNGEELKGTVAVLAPG